MQILKLGEGKEKKAEKEKEAGSTEQEGDGRLEHRM